jgi:hypothetical protein
MQTMMKLWNVYRNRTVRPTYNERALLGEIRYVIEAQSYQDVKDELILLLGPVWYEEVFVEEVRPLPIRLITASRK